MEINFFVFVPGLPAPKGSAKSFWHKTAKKIVTMQDNAARQKPWASMISLKAAEAMKGAPPTKRAVRLSMDFFMPRPKYHTGKRGLKESAPRFHGTKPDVDKLARCVLDALTGIVYEDDSQVYRIYAKKSYSDSRLNPVGLQLSAESFEELK